jgi:general stress protein 26
MERDAQKKLIDYLAAHPALNLATVGPEGTPLVHTVIYVSEGPVVFFSTEKTSRKAKNIMANPAVAYTVDEDQISLGAMQGIQMTGKAHIVTDGATMGRIGQAMLAKFPIMKDMPASPDYVFIRIDPVEGYFLDNTVKFGYRDRLTF